MKLITMASVAVAALGVVVGAQNRRPASPVGSSATEVGGKFSEREGYVGGKWIEVQYGRPIRRGRNLFGPADYAECAGGAGESSCRAAPGFAGRHQGACGEGHREQGHREQGHREQGHRAQGRYRCCARCAGRLGRD